MADVGRSSRARFRRYRKQIKNRPKGQPRPAEVGHDGLILGQTKSTHRHRTFWRLFVEFWGLLRGERRPMVIALLALSLATLLGLVPLYGTKLVVDNVLDTKPLPPQIPAWVHLPDDPRHLLILVCVGMVVLATLSMIVSTWSRWQATRISKRVVVTSRREVFDHAVRLPLHRVYDLKSGGLASILREDAGGVGELVFSMLYNPWRAIVQLVGSLIVLALVDWRLLLGSLALLPTVWLTHRLWIGHIRPVYRDIRATRQGIDSHATEAFGGMRVVRSFGRQKSESGQFTRGNHLMARQEIYAWWWMRGVDAAWAVLIPLASAILLWYGGMQILSDAQRVRAGTLSPHEAMTTGDLVMFLGYLMALLGPVATLAQSATSFQNNLAGLDRSLDLLDEPPEMPPGENARVIDRHQVAGRLNLRQVDFAYTGSTQPVLRQINLDVAPGQMVALVGPSGAGKTTLCNLIARFYDPTAGRIELDGVDLRDIEVDSYRRLLGIVEQDTFLFDGTVAENIAYGRRGATRAQIIEAARQANAHEFISELERGYDTMIGERGVKLSGGQRQRLTIARAILANPKILILDEATSNLDSESERLIQRSLQTLMAGRTSFVIAHRLSTIAGADRIVVLEGGRIVEQGTHEQLMARSGRYRQMVELQTRPMAQEKRGGGNAECPMINDESEGSPGLISSS